MTNAPPQPHQIGDRVFALCRHRYFDSPSLIETVLTGLRFTETGLTYRFETL